MLRRHQNGLETFMLEYRQVGKEIWRLPEPRRGQDLLEGGLFKAFRFFNSF